MRRGLQRFQRWLGEQAWFPGGDTAYSLSSSALELGVAEPPPASGSFRKLAFHSRMLWRRVAAEAKADWPLLKPRLWVIIPCLLFQYVHAIFTGMAYYMHTPLPVDNATLHDIGYEALPYLDVDAVSEVLVYLGFAQFFVWLVSPFVTRRKTFSASVVLKRVLVVLVSCQVLRILTFLSTQIPAPAPHCRAPEPTADIPWPVWWKVLIVNVARQASKGCGDLIFSSHLTFLLVFAWTYCHLGRYLILKLWAFLYAAATALCIIASRKHYTVDCVVAAYVVPLVAFHYFRTWTHRRHDIATADNRGLVSLLAPGLPVAVPPPSSGHGVDGGKGPVLAGSGRSSADDSSRKPSDSQQVELAVAAAGSGVSGLHGGEAPTDLEMAAQQPSSPVLEAPSTQPGSPVKTAWSALTDLPRRMGGRGGSTHHRRTDSQEPVLSQQDSNWSASPARE